jgi:anti-repressor protein
MNQITVFKQQNVLSKNFRVFGSIDEPLFLAKDVAEWIEHTDLSRMMDLVDDEEKLKRTLYVSGQNREFWFLSEDGLYEVLMQSRKPIAKAFKKEVKKYCGISDYMVRILFQERM